MKHSFADIEKIIREEKIFKNPEISFFKEGFGNYNYLIKENGKNFILRAKKSTEKQFKDSLKNEFTFLSFLNFKKIEFVPQALYYSDKNNFLLEEFIEGEKISQKNFNEEQIKLFAKQICILSALNIQEFKNFCENNKLKLPKKFNLKKLLDVYGFVRFHEIRKERINRKLLAIVEKELLRIEKIIKSSKINRKHGISWGDVQSEVILGKSNILFFYDFEHMQISTENDLAYIKVHGKFNNKQFNYLVDCYIDYGREKKETILEKIRLSERVIRINDAVWSLMMWSNAESLKDRKFFEKLTEKRIKFLTLS